MNISKVIRPFWLAYGLSLVVVACAVWQGWEVRKRRAELADLRQQIASAAGGQTTHAKLKERVEALRADVRRLAERAPVEVDLGTLLQEVSGGVGGGANNREISTKATVKGNPLDQVPVTIRSATTAKDALNLLRNIEQAGRLTRVDKVTFEQNEPGADKPIASTIDFSVFARSSEDSFGPKGGK
jgi:Tfp pilus assembly protein PilO